MSRLEQKLDELGYKKETYDKYKYYKFVTRFVVYINIKNRKKIGGSVFVESGYIYDDIVIENLQQAFDEMQKDLEVLNNVKD